MAPLLNLDTYSEAVVASYLVWVGLGTSLPILFSCSAEELENQGWTDDLKMAGTRLSSWWLPRFSRAKLTDKNVKIGEKGRLVEG